MSEGFTDAHAEDPMSAIDQFFRIVAERYEQWVKSGRLPPGVARNRVSPGTIDHRMWKSFLRKLEQGVSLTTDDVERMTMRAIDDKLSELIRKETRRGPAGTIKPFSDLIGADSDDDETIESIVESREEAPEVYFDRERIVEAVRGFLHDTKLTEQETMLLRYYLVLRSENAAADEAGIPRTSARRCFRDLFDKLRRYFAGLEEGGAV